MGPTYQRYFEAMPGYLTVQDRDFRIIDANKKYREDFGDWQGRTCYHVYKRRSEPCEICPVALTFRDHRSHSSEERVRPLNGSDISVLVNTTPIFDSDGNVEAVMEMSTDITEIKQLQSRLKESQERYRLLFEEVPCYISIQDRSLKIVEANRRFREDFGTHLGCPCYEVYKHRDEECIVCPVQETFNDGQVHSSEEVVTSKHGEQISTLVYSAPIRGDDGQIKCVMEMSTNITPIRQLQSQLESMGIIVSSISHGIKGLLTGLDGGTYLVNSGLKRDQPQRVEEGWEMVQRNVERIRSMVMNILYYAKEREPNWETLQASAVVEDVCKAMQSKANNQGTALRLDLDGDAGQFEGDAQAVRALLTNLLDNSLDACSADKRKSAHEVAVCMRGYPDRVEFVVQDNGIGMDRETRQRAFSRFFSSKGMAGTGLGLFIAGNIATKHGGTIELKSEQGEGTTFMVKIPRTRARSEAA